MTTDLDTVRSAFPEPNPASPDVVAAARGDLQNLIREARQPSRSGWARSHRRGIVLTAGAATVAIAALGTPLVLSPGQTSTPGQDDGALPSVSTPTAKALTGGQILLAAATYQERAAEATSGRWFQSRELLVNRSLRIGQGSSAYSVERRTLISNWTGAPGQKSFAAHRELGARPATAADQERWVAAGSPQQWNLGPGDTAEKADVIVSTAPGKGWFSEVGGSDRYYVLRNGLTAAEIAALPTDPSELRRRILRDKPSHAASDTSWLVGVTRTLLFQTPASPKVRAAAFRLLAELPGIEVETGVRDGLGRRGTGITFADDNSTSQLIIDPQSGRLLSGRYNSLGIKVGEDVVLESGWTDEAPKPLSTKIR